MSCAMRDEKPRIIAAYSELITSKDARQLIVETCGTDGELVDYSLRPYSDEKIGFLGSHHRLIVTVRSKSDEDDPPLGPSSELHFFVKLMPYDVPTQAKYVEEKGVFRQETYFFGSVVPELTRDFTIEPWTARCHIIKNDCLIFEDLRLNGFRMRDKLFTETEIRAGLDAIARLHAASLYAEARLSCPLNILHPNAFEERAFLHRGNQYRWYLAGVDVAIKIAESLDLPTTKIREACDLVFEAIKPSTKKQNVTSHGDLWANNLMFDDEISPKCRLVDFQLARYSPIAHDVAQFLYLCASREFRDKRADEMLRYYYDSLRFYLKKNSTINVNLPSWRDLVDGYEEQKIGALVTAVMYFPTVLLDGQTGATIMNDSEAYAKFVMEDRRDIVLANMERDEQYRHRLNETVRELVEMSLRLDDLPKPC